MVANKESETVDLYGIPWPKDATTLSVEIWCYVNDWGPDFKKWELLVAEGEKPSEELLAASLEGLGREAHFRKAFKLAWPNFFWHDWFEMEVTAWCNEKEFTAIGHTRASKTYGLAYILFLDWLASPMDTLTTIASMSLERLRGTMGRDILEAIGAMAMIGRFIHDLEIVNSVNEFRISLRPQPGMNEAQKKELKAYSILGIAIKNMTHGQIQGRHTERRRMVGDETAAFPDTYFTAEKNAASAPDFISVHLANPNEKTTKFGNSCKPKNGWKSVDENTDHYRTITGRLILHFNGLKSYNMVLYRKFQNKEIDEEKYREKEATFLIRQDYIASIEVGTLEYYMYVLGWFPKDGLVSRVYPDSILEIASKTIEFDFSPTPFGLCDPGYESDNCVVHVGEYEKQRDDMIGVQMKKTHKIATHIDDDSQVKEFQIADRIQEKCEGHDIIPANFALDCTGNGRAVAAILDKQWGKVHRIEWGGSPSDRPMSSSDTVKANEKYCYFVDELAFRLREWMMSGRMGGLDNLDPKTVEQLAPRQYDIRPDGKFRIENKKAYKKRLGESPDFADALKCLGEFMAVKNIFPDAIDKEHVGDNYMAQRKRAIAASSIYEDEYCDQD